MENIYSALAGSAVFLVWLLMLLLPLWTLVDCATKEPRTETERKLWMIIIVLLPIIGALGYLLIRRPSRGGHGALP
jgi:hypothetical protein